MLCRYIKALNYNLSPGLTACKVTRRAYQWFYMQQGILMDTTQTHQFSDRSTPNVAPVVTDDSRCGTGATGFSESYFYPDTEAAAPKFSSWYKSQSKHCVTSWSTSAASSTQQECFLPAAWLAPHSPGLHTDCELLQSSENSQFHLLSRCLHWIVPKCYPAPRSSAPRTLQQPHPAWVTNHVQSNSEFISEVCINLYIHWYVPSEGLQKVFGIL